MSIPDHIIDQINERADLVSIIGRHVPLKKSGASFKGCCPFHKEKTPSFYVHPREGYYYCFGCKASGNAIGFLMDYENVPFLEAVETLAAQTGTIIPKDKPNPAYVYKKRTQHSPPKPSQKSNTTQPKQNLPNNQSIAQPPSQTTEQVAQRQGYASTNNSTNLSTNQVTDAGFDDVDAANAALAAALDAPINLYDDVGYADAPASGSSSEPFQSHNDAQSTGQEGSLFDLAEKLCSYYQSKLKTNPKALLYLNQRGLTEETIDGFRLGYAPSDWQHLENAFSEDIEGLKMLGLVRLSESGRSYDLLRERIIFPIRDHRGRVVGFGARALAKDVQPKYINSPESALFKKQHILYGLYESRKARADNWLVVEGFMDVIALYQAGIYGAVASMGTALGADALKKLLSMNPQLTLAFDGDAAGQAAAWRAMEIALPVLEDKFSLKFLTLPDGDDPDAYIKSHGKAAFLEQLEGAPALSDFIYTSLAAKHGVERVEQKSALMAEAKKLFDTLPKFGSYKRLLYTDLRERLGLGFSAKSKQQSQAQMQALSDKLLNFDTRFSLQERAVFLLLKSPAVLSNSSQLSELLKLMPSSSLLVRVNQLIEQTLSVLEVLMPSAQAHFLLCAWMDAGEQKSLIQGFFAFEGALTKVGIGHIEGAEDEPHAQLLYLFNDLCLQLTEQKLKEKMAAASTLDEKNTLNDALLSVRKQLQFRS